MNERARRDKRFEKAIARRIEKRQGIRAHATLNEGSIRDGQVHSPDGINMSHRFSVIPVRDPRKKRYVEDRSAMGRFAEENGGFVWGLFKSSTVMAARWAEFELTQSDLARLIFIGTFTDYEGVIRHPNGVPIDRNSLREMVGIHQTKFDEFYDKLTAADILRESDGFIFMSSEVFQRGGIGKGEYVDRIRIYRDTVRELYEKYGKGRSVKQLGLIYSVIPFMHRNLNIICYNPLEKHDASVHLISLDKLALLLEYKDSTTLKRALRAVEVNKQPVFTFVDDANDSRKKRIIVNPRVVFAGDYDGLMACRGIAVLFN